MSMSHCEKCLQRFDACGDCLLSPQLAEARSEVERLKKQAHQQAMKMGARIQLTETANRKLVEAVESLRPDHTTECIGRMMVCKTGQEECLCGADTGMEIADKALSTPHAKLAAAQSEVLRAVSEVKKSNLFTHAYTCKMQQHSVNGGISWCMCGLTAIKVALEALEAVEKEVQE